MVEADYQKVVGSSKTLYSCYGNSNNDCGLGNELIDNGSYYWFATIYPTSSVEAFNWSPSFRSVRLNYSSDAAGLRPVLRLQSSVYVTGGSGTYEDPYTIGN